METLSSNTETTEGIRISSWPEFSNKSKIFKPEAIVKGIKLFSSEAPTPHEILEVVVGHPQQKSVFNHLLYYGELTAGYFLDDLKLYFIRYLPEDEEKIKLFNFRDYDDLLRFNLYLQTPSEEE